MRAVAVVIVGALVLGATGWAGAHRLGETGTSIANLGAPWLIAAWCAGRVASRHGLRPSVLAGAALPALGTAVYYAVFVTALGHPRYALAMTVLWGAAAVVAGAVFGALAASRGAFAAAAPGALLTGEALALSAVPGDASMVIHAELLAGLLVLALTTVRAPAAGLAAAPLVAAFGICDVALRLLMLGLGWTDA